VTIAFYISGHGFGHASRQAAIINAVGTLAPAARLVIRSAANPALLRRTVRVPFELEPGPCDSGVAQTTSVSHDDGRTLADALAFYRRWDDRVGEEVVRLSTYRPSAIVGDIPPLAFDVAAALSVPSVAVANFTWDWIYETQPGFDRHGDLLALIRNAYGKATLALQLPLSATFAPFRAVRSVPLVSHRAAHSRSETRAHFALDADRPVALLSFGGYGMPALDLAGLDCAETWSVVTTDPIAPVDRGARCPHVSRIGERHFENGPFRYEDLIAAADVVITKPGYGIIADCIAAGTAMVYTSRGAFREYDVLVRELPRFLRALHISQDDLFSGRWRRSLEAVTALPPPPEAPPTDGATAVARTILELSESGQL